MLVAGDESNRRTAATSSGAALDGHVETALDASLDGRVAVALDASLDGHTKAAVLVPVYVAGEELHVVLTRRRADLRRHAGEISFPGGRFDQGDLALSDTALREAEEEIGLRREEVSLAGALMPTSTFATKYEIHPFVGAIDAERAWTPSAHEVDAVLELPLRELRLAQGRTQLTRRGFTFETDAYELSGHVIWGATFRILQELIFRLAPLLEIS